MISDELLSKFNRIQDLPVSEEMLGAYLEGNLNQKEAEFVGTSISEDQYVMELVEAISISSTMENFSEMIDFPDDSFFINIYENDNDMDNLNKASYNVYGEQSQNLIDPVYIQQPDDHSCALRSQQIVLRDFGIDIPFEKLEELAKSYGVYSDQGTYTYDIGKVLQIAGVGMHQVQGSTFYDLTNELAQGHRVIVSVDAHELWYTDPMSKLKNWFNDAIGRQGGNHALIVAGVQVNPDDPNDIKVILTDPGSGHLRVEYPLDRFMDAWKDSKCFMAATDQPAPYQYDPETGKEVPSNFMVQQVVNEFIASNGYQLSPDLINIPQDYQPAFIGHVNMIGDIDYSTFEKDYQDYTNSKLPSSISIAEQIEETAKRRLEAVDSAHNTENYLVSENCLASNAKTLLNESGLASANSHDVDNQELKFDDPEEDDDSINEERDTESLDGSEEDDDDNDDFEE